MEIDFSRPWPRIPIIQGLEQRMGSSIPRPLESEEARTFLLQQVSLISSLVHKDQDESQTQQHAACCTSQSQRRRTHLSCSKSATTLPGAWIACISRRSLTDAQRMGCSIPRPLESKEACTFLLQQVSSLLLVRYTVSVQSMHCLTKAQSITAVRGGPHSTAAASEPLLSLRKPSESKLQSDAANWWGTWGESTWPAQA